MTTHTLYRFFGASDELLYVGITNNPARRFSKHRDEREWWQTVARIQMEQFSNRESLAAAERTAIQTEKPLHNVRMNGSLRQDSKGDDTSRLPKGLRIGSVYAIGMEDGSCPVGLVIDGDTEGIVITKMSWWTGNFSLPDEWLPGDEICRWIKAEPLDETDEQVRTQRLLSGSKTATVVDCEPLGAFQTAWTKRAEERLKMSAAADRLGVSLTAS